MQWPRGVSTELPAAQEEDGLPHLCGSTIPEFGFSSSLGPGGPSKGSLSPGAPTSLLPAGRLHPDAVARVGAPALTRVYPAALNGFPPFTPAVSGGMSIRVP
jgi:hypothetical protein